MPLHNADIARFFEDIADLLELGDENPFRIRAYRNASRIIGDLQLDLAALIRRGEELPKLPGIGEDLSGKIHEIVTTGHCALLDRLRKKTPAAITELLRIPSLGPKRVKALYRGLEVGTLDDLYRAARDGRIRALPGFGEKSELNILQSVEARLSKGRRFKLAVAAQYADAVADYLRHLVKGRVTRYAVPGIGALNFVMEQALGGGGLASLRSDPLGKGMAQIVLSMPVRVPKDLL